MLSTRTMTGEKFLQIFDKLFADKEEAIPAIEMFVNFLIEYPKIIFPFVAYHLVAIDQTTTKSLLGEDFGSYHIVPPPEQLEINKIYIHIQDFQLLTLFYFTQEHELSSDMPSCFR